MCFYQGEFDISQLPGFSEELRRHIDFSNIMQERRYLNPID